MYENVQRTLRRHGEVIVTMDSGAVYELHQDSEWDESEGLIEFEDGDGETHNLDGDNIESYYTHPSHRMNI